jgi:hypothetical protein
MQRLASYKGQEIPAKHQATLTIVQDVISRGGKVVCWSNFIANLDQLARFLEAHCAAPVFQIDGRVPVGDETQFDDPTTLPRGETLLTREEVIGNFLGTKGSAVLVTNPASMSESVSLHHGCYNAIYLDRTYDSALFLQSVDRVHRLGLPEDVTVKVHILQSTLFGSQTIDHLVEASLLRKEANMLQLLQGAELAPLSLSDEPSTDADGDVEDLGTLLRYLLGEDP